MTKKKRNVSSLNDMPSSSSSLSSSVNSSSSFSSAGSGGVQKRLRRLPHVFSKVLQLPFSSDADVSVDETPDCFRFVAERHQMGGDVRALAVEIHPGVTKIVVGSGGDAELSLDEMEVDVWRFRLPESTLPDSATAVFADGKLVVTVPKRRQFAAVEVFGGLGQLVLVQ